MSVDTLPTPYFFSLLTSRNNNNTTPILSLKIICILILGLLIFPTQIFSKNEFYTFPDVSITHPTLSDPRLCLRFFAPFSISNVVAHKWVQDITFTYSTVKTTGGLSRFMGSAFNIPSPFEQLVSSARFGFSDGYYHVTTETPYRLSAGSDSSFFPSMIFQFKLQFSETAIKHYSIGDHIGDITFTLRSTYTESPPKTKDPEFSPYHTIKIPIYRHDTPFYTPPITPKSLVEEQEVSAVLNAIMIPWWKGNKFISPYTNHFVQNVTLGNPMRWSMNIPWNTQLGGRNGDNKTELGKVRPKFLRFLPQGNFFFQQNSTKPFVEGFSCWVNDITVPAIMTSHVLISTPPSFSEPFGPIMDQNDDPDDDLGDDFDDQKNIITKPRLIQQNPLKSHETILQITLNDQFWDLAINQQLLRFHSFSVHCGSTVVLMEPNIGYAIEWELFNSAIIVELTDEPLVNQSGNEFLDQFRKSQNNQAIYRILVPFTQTITLIEPEYTFQWTDKVPIEWITHHLKKNPETIDGIRGDYFDFSEKGTDNDDDDVNFQKSSDNDDNDVNFKKSTDDDDFNYPKSISTESVSSSYYPLPDDITLPLLIPPTVIAPTSKPNKNTHFINLSVLVTMIIHIEHLSTPSCDFDSETGKPDDYCDFQLSISLPSADDHPESFQPVTMQEYINIYFETLDGNEKWLVQTQWETSFMTKRFDFPGDYVGRLNGKYHRYLKLTFSLQLHGGNLLKFPTLWEKNEIYLKFHPFKIFPNQLPIFIPHHIPIERWFLDARHAFGEGISIPSIPKTNTIVDLEYEKIIWDWKTMNTKIENPPQFIFFQQKQQLDEKRKIDLTGNNDQIISYVTIHISGAFEFSLGQFDPTLRYHRDNQEKRGETGTNNFLDPRPDLTPVLLKCKGIKTCSATDVILTSRAISFKVNIDDSTNNNNNNSDNKDELANRSNIFQNFLHFFKKSTENFPPEKSPPQNLSKLEQSKGSTSPISIQITLSDEIHYSRIHYTPLKPEKMNVALETMKPAPETMKVASEPINLIAHVTLTNTTSGQVLDHNFGLTFEQNHNLDDIPSSFVVPDNYSYPFWLYILIIALIIMIFILIFIVYCIITMPKLGNNSSELETSLIQAVENRMKGQFSNFMSAVNKALDEYQPPLYADLDENGQPLEQLPEYDLEIEGNTNVVDGGDETKVTTGEGKEQKNKKDDIGNGFHDVAPLPYENLFFIDTPSPNHYLNNNTLNNTTHQTDHNTPATMKNASTTTTIIDPAITTTTTTTTIATGSNHPLIADILDLNQDKPCI